MIFNILANKFINMKKTILAMAVTIGLFTASCNTTAKTEGTHTHEDGTVHEAHDHGADSTQNMKTDSVAVDTAHSHEGHAH